MGEQDYRLGRIGVQGTIVSTGYAIEDADEHQFQVSFAQSTSNILPLSAFREFLLFICHDTDQAITLTPRIRDAFNPLFATADGNIRIWNGQAWVDDTVVLPASTEKWCCLNSVWPWLKFFKAANLYIAYQAAGAPGAAGNLAVHYEGVPL